MSQWPIRVLVYGAGDAINGFGALDPLIRTQLGRLGQVATNRVVAAVAQLDSSTQPSVRYVLDPGGQQPISQLPEVDTGDPAELVRFAEWSAATLPARRTVLVLSGHGAGWQDGQASQAVGARLVPGSRERRHARSLFRRRPRGRAATTWAVLLDGTDRDFLSNAELGAACQRIAGVLGGPIDVLVFDACLMMSWEVVQELAGSVKAVVGSIDELSAAGIDLAWPAYDLSIAGGEVDAPAMAAAFTHRFVPQAAFDSCVAVDTSRPEWLAALGSFQAFVGTLLPWIRAQAANAEAVRAALRYAATSVVKFTSGGLADVGALASAIAAIPGAPPSAIAAVTAAADALRACVVGRSVGADYQAALGISVFCPNSVTVHEANRGEYDRLRFSTVTGWGELLDALYGFEATRGAPPQPASPPGDAEYRVALRGLDLDQATKERVEAAIQSAVLHEVAALDLKGTADMNAPVAGPETRFGFRDLLPIIMGIVYRAAPEA